MLNYIKIMEVPVEEYIQRSLFTQKSEKTVIDKLLARQDVESVRLLIKKPHLTREDLLELLYLLSGVEMKLLNYGEWERYVMAKYFVWIREFVAVAEQLYDYKDDLEEKENICCYCLKYFKEYKNNKKLCKCKSPKPIVSLSERSKQLFKNNMRYMEHNIKFLTDLYFNLARTTLSLGGTGLLELLKSKFEIFYPNMPQQPVQQDTGRGLFGLRKGQK